MELLCFKHIKDLTFMLRIVYFCSQVVFSIQTVLLFLQINKNNFKIKRAKAGVGID